MGAPLGGWARPARPWDVGFSLRHAGPQGRAQRLGLLGHRLALALVGLGCVVLQALGDVRAAVLQQARAQPSALVRRGRERLGGAEARVHPPPEGPHGTRGVVPTACGETQGDGAAMRPGGHPPRQPLAARDLVLGTPPQPATAVWHARPPGHVGAERTEEDERSMCLDPLDGRQGEARPVREGDTGIEARCVGLCVSAGVGGQGLPSAWVGTGLQRRVALLIALGARLVGAVGPLDGLSSGTQVCGPPGAWQGLGALVRSMLAMGGTQLGQGYGGARARHARFEESHAGHAGEVPDNLGTCAGHLWPGLVPVLPLVGGRGAQPRAVAPGAAEPAPLRRGTQGPGEPPVGVQALPPLASEPLGLRSTGGARRLTGVDQEDLEASRLPECPAGHPVAAGRCHRDGGHATGTEPGGAGGAGDGAGAETAPGLGGAPRRHGAPVRGVADVEARGLGVADLEGVGEHGCWREPRCKEQWRRVKAIGCVGCHRRLREQAPDAGDPWGRA